MDCYLEHVAFHVRDIKWHINFFRDALGMPIRQISGDAESPEQVWFHGGIQLKSDPNFAGGEGRMAHLGIVTGDLDAMLRRVHAKGAEVLPQGENWVKLPDGLEIEFIQAKTDAVKNILSEDTNP